MRYLLPAFILCGLLGNITTLRAADKPAPGGKPGAEATAASDPTGDRAWEDLQKAIEPPDAPAEWKTKRPEEEEVEKFRGEMRRFVEAAADKAKGFYTSHPNHPKADEARATELQLVQAGVQELGAKNLAGRLETLSALRENDPKVGEDERFRIKAFAVQRRARAKLSESESAALAEYEKGVRGLQKEFPKRPEIWQMLFSVAKQAEPEVATRLAREISEGAAPDEMKAEAGAILKKMSVHGKPLALKFTAVDGREISIEKLKGKVVLIDFWATWCGPCVRELPNVKAAYEKLHPKGFEIVGISFDKKKSELEQFVKAKEMTWPQYFDGKGWGNDFGVRFGIDSIPAMWLVDKKGVVRDLNARDGLAGKVEKFLAEKD
jgi:thiol-disulfide isomerase/thioredoxin